MERSGGVAAIGCDTTGNCYTVRRGYCYTCLAIGGCFRSPQSAHHPHKNNQEDREFNPGGGVHFALFLVANFLGRLMWESRVENHDLKINAAPDCFQPPKTGCRPHRLRLPLWTTPSHSQEPLLSSSHISCLRLFYLVRPFWHFSLERSFILLTFDLISLSWVSPFVWSSMFLPSSFTTLLVFQRLCGVWISLQPLPASTSATSAATANAAHHFAFYNYCDCQGCYGFSLHVDKGKERVQKIPKSDNLPPAPNAQLVAQGFAKRPTWKIEEDLGKSRKI